MIFKKINSSLTFFSTTWHHTSNCSTTTRFISALYQSINIWDPWGYMDPCWQLFSRFGLSSPTQKFKNNFVWATFIDTYTFSIFIFIFLGFMANIQTVKVLVDLPLKKTGRNLAEFCLKGGAAKTNLLY